MEDDQCDLDTLLEVMEDKEFDDDTVEATEDVKVTGPEDEVEDEEDIERQLKEMEEKIRKMKEKLKNLKNKSMDKKPALSTSGKYKILCYLIEESCKRVLKAQSFPS